MKRILVTTKFVPTGLAFGGMTRTVRLVDGLRQRFDVRILGYVENGDPSPRDPLRSLVNSFAARRPYQISRYDTPWLRTALQRELEEFQPDAIHVDYLQLAPLSWDLELPQLLDLHNVESALAASIAKTSRGPSKILAARDARLLRRTEQRAGEVFPVITAPSAKEAQRMPGNVHVIPNGVDPSREPLDVPIDPNLVVFVGIFSWGPNIDGAEWFVHEVLPLLPESMKVQLVGRNPAKRVQALAGPRVEVTGEVPDTWPYVSRACAVLAPLLAPGGTRHKILEGLLAARPVVATPEAADGLEDLADRGMVLAGDPRAFADAILAYSRDLERAAADGRTGRDAVVAGYDWKVSCGRLLDLYESELGLS